MSSGKRRQRVPPTKQCTLHSFDRSINLRVLASRTPMNALAAPAQTQSAATAGPASAAPPPKQRFKEAVLTSEGESLRQKRPLPSSGTQAVSEGDPTSQEPTGSAALAAGRADLDTEDAVEAAKQGGKQQRIQPSLIRGIAPYRKPRVGPEFQAAIPSLQPRPPPAQ